MLPTRVHLLSKKGSYLNASVVNGPPNNYVIGFFDKRQADLVRRKVDLKRPIQIISSAPENISTDVNMGLKNFGVDTQIGMDLVIDCAAELRIPYKVAGGGRTSVVKDDADMEIVSNDTGEFLLWPIEQYLGVVMPLGGDFEEDIIQANMVFMCHYIQPSMDFEKFRKNLKL